MAKQKINWKKVISREYGVQYTEMSLNSLSFKCKFIIPRPFCEQVYIPENGNESCYMDGKKWDLLAEEINKIYIEKNQNYEEFDKLFVKAGNEYIKVAREISDKNLKNLSNKELKSLYLKFQEKGLRYSPFIWMQFIINNFIANKAKKILIKKLGEGTQKLDKYYKTILKPDEKAASVKITDLAILWKKMANKERNLAYNEFKWIPCSDIHNNPWKKEEFFVHMKDFSITKEKESLSYNQVLRELDASKKEKRIFDIAKRSVYLKDLKDDFRRQGVFYGQALFKEIAKRMSINLKEISYLQEDEILLFLKKGKNVAKEIIKERMKGFILFFDSSKRLVCKTNGEMKNILKKFGFENGNEVLSKIKGVSASLGKAGGMVTIVRKVVDLKKMRKGNVLVSISTHPDYISAMQKASAIITEEGGLTSHAAIVARELNIPCIVGTKIATKILKDGDLVEVDANKGIVKILK